MKGIFQGIKILDFTWVIVGPTTTRYFADQGATVIRIETIDHPCALRQSPPYKDGKSGINSSAYFAAYNTNKMSFGVNLSHPDGTRLVKQLVSWADVVLESFAPGVMEKLGLGYEELKRIKPDIIFLRSNMLGLSGPRARVRGYGFQLVGYSGFSHITGWSDRIPNPPFGAYTDTIAPRFATSAVILALMHRKRTGKGTYIDLSQHEAGIQFLIPILLNQEINDKTKGREGNSHPSFCPHGVYPCQGHDRWIAISITSEEEWKVLSSAIDQEWAHDSRFASAMGRKQNEEEINSLTSQWTSGYTPEELFTLLQGRGIPAGIVQNSRDIVNDPQLIHRNAIWYLNHEYAGKHAVFSQSFILSKSPLPVPKPAPKIGEHTFKICKEILNMTDEEAAKLIGDGILQIQI